MRIVTAVLGALVVLGTWASVVRSLVVPRRSPDRISRGVDRAAEALFLAATAPVRSYALRDRMLSLMAPMTILVQLAVWLGLLFAGFALLIAAVTGVDAAHALAQAGSSLLTLGYAGPTGASLTVVDYLAAASGLVVVALQIGYLPTLYSAFNRREVEVTLLRGRAGVPPWGPEVLARSRYGFGPDEDGAVLGGFYRDWERWAADVGESHSNYPVLARFRSPGALSSWLTSLVAVMDSAALWLSLSPSTAPAVECRLALRMGFTALRSLATTLGLPVDDDPDPDGELALSYQEYLEGVARITSTTFRVERSAEQAWPDFRGWRVNYESVAYALAARLDQVPGPWSGRRRPHEETITPVRPTNRRPTPHPGGATSTPR